MNKEVQEYLKDITASYLYKEEDFDEFIRFDMGESSFGFSHMIHNELNSFSDNDLHDYSDPCLYSVKSKISRKYTVPKENITIGCGSDEIIELIPRIFLNPGDKVITTPPTFFRFSDSVKRVGGVIIPIPFKEENNFLFDDNMVDEIISNSKDVKLIFLCNPNNPTGVKISKDQIVKILKNVSSLVVVDEALYEYIDPENKYSSYKLVNDYNNLIVLKTLSKAYGLAGLRFGYAFSNKNYIKLFEQFRLPYNSSIFAQKIAVAALGDESHLIKNMALTKNLMESFLSQLKKLKNISLGSNSETNMVFLKHKSKDLFSELKKRKILVADFRNYFGVEGKGFVRIVIRSEKLNNILIEKLKEIN